MTATEQLFERRTDRFEEVNWTKPRLASITEGSKNLINQFHLERNADFFVDKVAIVTGSSSGIGRAIALQLANLGAKVVLASRCTIKNEVWQDEISRMGTEAHVVHTDVTHAEQCKQLIDSTIERFGKIDYLINNAGISMRANFNETNVKVLEAVMETNFWGSVYCTKYALPHILKRGGSIVGMSSICGTTPLPGRTGYSASKHALDGFMKSLRVENKSQKLHVMLVHPGFTRSNIRNTALDKNGMPQKENPLDESKLMSADHVAKEVALGIINRKKNITLGIEGKVITWLHKLLPSMAETMIYRSMRKEEGALF